MRISESYVEAALRISQKNEAVTIQALAAERLVDERVVRRYFERHPDEARAIGLVSYTEHMYASYRTAAALIRAARQENAPRQIKTDELRRQLGFSERRIRAFLSRHAALAQEIGWTDGGGT